jgi:hypothetical protein
VVQFVQFVQIGSRISRRLYQQEGHRTQVPTLAVFDAETAQLACAENFLMHDLLGGIVLAQTTSQMKDRRLRAARK